MNKTQKQIIFVGLLMVFLVWSFMRGCEENKKLPAVKQKEQVKNYLELYSEAAMREMQRSQVPASITLAQGILESGYGKSGLAINAKNHFGVKCGKGWKGDKYCAPSDEWSPRQKKMVKKTSCFRAYNSAEDSFRDHSDFLHGKERYNNLFELDISDYKAWAQGLSDSGYATDPQYAAKLISLIERFKLYQYDTSIPSKEVNW